MERSSYATGELSTAMLKWLICSMCRSAQVSHCELVRSRVWKLYVEKVPFNGICHGCSRARKPEITDEMEEVDVWMLGCQKAMPSLEMLMRRAPTVEHFISP
jgi:hypothetical protein